MLSEHIIDENEFFLFWIRRKHVFYSIKFFAIGIAKQVFAITDKLCCKHF